MATWNDLSKYRWRKVKHDGKMVRQRRVEESLLEGYASAINAPDLIIKIQQAGLEESTVEVTHDYQANYGDCEYGLVLKGWREATDDEIREALAEVDQAKAERREWEERQAAELRRRRPDLFKDT